MTMPIEATEHAGPVIIWRKELRPDSGGAGKTRGGLGQYMEVGAQEGHEFDIQAMFDRVDHPAREQFVAHGRRVVMAFPGGAGYGDPSERSADLVKRDLARGYISAETAARDYNLSVADIADVKAAVARADTI